MKKIMVFDVPAESGGAMTILNQYYEMAKKDKHIEWIFVLSTPELAEQENIEVLRYPWIKKSWFHRLFFDRFIAHRLVKKNNPDEVISLQNVIISKVNQFQTLYLHQALPFVEKRYKITENFKLWIYQNIISKTIYNSIRKADRVIVQTKWIMEAAINKTGAVQGKFILNPPKIAVDVTKMYSLKNSEEQIFFYPANGAEYKNHRIIIEAIRNLVRKGTNNFIVLFTLNGNESDYIKNLYQEVNEENLPIKFIGYLTREEVYEYYSKSILIFPSYIETFGLPLLEARMHKTPVLASDTRFSHEILKNYKYAYFFSPFDELELARLIEKHITT